MQIYEISGTNAGRAEHCRADYFNASVRSSLIQILELQQKKRDLADAILNADNRVISTLTREDLEFLLS